MLPLLRIRLLPATIAAIVALMLVKSALLVQAVAQEAAPPAKAEAPTPQAAPVAPPPPQAAPVASVTSAPPAATPAPKPELPKSPTTDAAKMPDTPPVSEAERAVLLDLRERRKALETRAKELDQRSAELEAADRRLNDRVQQLSALQSRLESLEAEREKHKAENWAGLVKVYESMKPREAAAIFDSLDMQVLLQVLDRMQERRMAPVLAAMQPDRARLATQLLAEMRTRATTPPPSQTHEPKG
jgi:flagellar motility protein MotE (MotC chaperone)